MIFPHFSRTRLILRASFGGNAPKIILAALALKEDTIPKPDGLAMVTESAEIEQNSNDIEQCSKMFEDCSHCIRESQIPACEGDHLYSDGVCRRHTARA
jgi:cytochrome c2